jgi:hypothetical protein
VQNAGRKKAEGKAMRAVIPPPIRNTRLDPSVWVAHQAIAKPTGRSRNETSESRLKTRPNSPLGIFS